MEMAKPISVAKQRRARAAWVFELGPEKLTLATILLVSVTSLLYLTQASRVAATGYDISFAEARRSELEREQQALLVKVAQLQSLARIEEEATSKLGMVPAPLPEFLRAKSPEVDFDAAITRAERAARHEPPSWWEPVARLMRLRRPDPDD